MHIHFLASDFGPQSKSDWLSFGMWLGFISRSVRVRLQVSVCGAVTICATLVNIQTHTQTSFWPAYQSINQSIKVMTNAGSAEHMPVSLLKNVYHFNNNFQYHTQIDRRFRLREFLTKWLPFRWRRRQTIARLDRHRTFITRMQALQTEQSQGASVS